MTKKQLQQRLLDIAAGAGISVDGEGEEAYWSFDVHGPGESLCYLLRGVKEAFNLPDDSIFIGYWNLDEWDTPAEALDFLWRNRSELE